MGFRKRISGVVLASLVAVTLCGYSVSAAENTTYDPAWAEALAQSAAQSGQVTQDAGQAAQALDAAHAAAAAQAAAQAQAAAAQAAVNQAAAAQAAAAPAQETSPDGNAGNGNQETVNPEEAGAAVTEEEVLLNGGETPEGAGETGTEGGESVSAEGGQTGTALVLESVYLRSQASTESEAITTLYPGFEVQVTGSEGEWSKITYQEMNGYIKTEFHLFE